jgi:hypothetical protein
MERFENYRPSKTALAWCCVLSVIATIVVGFAFGGWVTGGTATAMADSAGERAGAKLAAEVCIAQFNHNPDAQTQLAALTKLESWDRAGFVTKGGWATLPGGKNPVTGAADLCAQRLTSTTLSSARQ